MAISLLSSTGSVMVYSVNFSMGMDKYSFTKLSGIQASMALPQLVQWSGSILLRTELTMAGLRSFDGMATSR